MLGLSNALETARNSLQDSSTRSAVLSKNILGVNDPSYSRRIYSSNVTGQSGVQSVTVRATSVALASKMLSAVSKEGYASSQASMLAQLQTLMADPQSAMSLPAQFATLSADMTRFAADPSSSALATQVISTADRLVGSLRGASEEIASTREMINARMEGAANDLKSLLTQLQELDDGIAKGMGPGRDINDLSDQRDAIVEKISQYVAVRAVSGEGGRIALYTDSGLTLFDRLPREISVTQSFDAGLGGYVSDIRIDGLDATSSSSFMALRSGELAGLVQFRNNVLAPANAQIDEMARSLIEVFADRDRNVPATVPDLPGLVTTDTPLGGVPNARVVGLAGQLKLSDFAYSSEAPVLLRDGGFANPLDPAYNHNVNSDPAYSGRIQSILAQFEMPRALDPAGLIVSNASLASYASNGATWLSVHAKSITDEKETQAATRQYAFQQLKAVTGVSLDDETARMLEVEHAYQATAKLISTIDNMLSALLGAIN